MENLTLILLKATAVALVILIKTHKDPKADTKIAGEPVTTDTPKPNGVSA